ncbi:hypothetical protein AOLI_G00278560 [Acnodon oligacanthus]
MFWKNQYATAPRTSPRSRSVLLSSLSKEVQACLLKDPWFTSHPITSKHAIQQPLIMKAYSKVEKKRSDVPSGGVMFEVNWWRHKFRAGLVRMLTLMIRRRPQGKKRKYLP